MDNNEFEQEQQPKKRMFYFQREGIIMPLWAIITLEKDENYDIVTRKETFIITLNRGIEQSERCPMGERRFCFDNEKVRDKKFEEVLSVMSEEFVDFVTI